MPLYRIGTRDVLFIHVPKTGGTSVNGMLRNQGPRCLHYTSKILGVKAPPQHFHADILSALFNDYPLDYAFMVVRHPIERAKSEYRMRAERGRLSGIDMNAWWRSCMESYPKNPFHLDNHIRPQSEFEMPGCRVFKLEAGLDAIMAEIFEDLRLEGRPPHVHARKGEEHDIVLTDETFSSLKTFYAKDFHRFGYEA